MTIVVEFVIASACTVFVTQEIVKLCRRRHVH